MARLAIEPMPYLPMVKAMAPKAPIGAAFIRIATSLKIGAGQRLQEIDHRLGRLADHGERKAEQHREEQHLQDIALGEGADDCVGDDVHQEADDGLSCAFSV